MKAQILDNALIITSALEYKTIQKLEKVAPNALALTECVGSGDNMEINEIFRIATGKTNEFSNYGVIFAGKNKDGYATCTVVLDTTKEDKKDFVMEKYASAFIKLNALESIVENAASQINADYKKIADAITVL